MRLREQIHNAPPIRLKEIKMWKGTLMMPAMMGANVRTIGKRDFLFKVQRLYIAQIDFSMISIITNCMVDSKACHVFYNFLTSATGLQINILGLNDSRSLVLK